MKNIKLNDYLISKIKESENEVKIVIMDIITTFYEKGDFNPMTTIEKIIWTDISPDLLKQKRSYVEQVQRLKKNRGEEVNTDFNTEVKNEINTEVKNEINTEVKNKLVDVSKNSLTSNENTLPWEVEAEGLDAVLNKLGI